ncbi:MAG: ROK family protein [Acidobacteriota bacterium]|nr:ROK family protein [Acidobacteriota bacterium]
MPKKYLALDLGGTFIKYGLLSEDGVIQVQGKVPAPTSTEQDTLGGLEQIRDMVGDVYEGVAVSMPGRIDTTRGIAHTGGSYSWAKDWPAESRVSSVFGKPTTVANDGKCAAQAELWKGALADVDSGVILVLGTAVGGGIVLNHKVWMGVSGGAGELSNLTTSYKSAIERGVGFKNLPVLWAYHVGAAGVTEQFARRKGLEHADGIMLFEAYDRFDEDARAVLEEFGRWLAVGILNVQAVLDVERYAIGGGISARPEVTQYASRAVKRLFVENPMPFSTPEIVTCRFGNEANLIGALGFHLSRG